MQLPSIGTVCHRDRLRQILDTGFRSLRDEGVHIDIGQRERGSMYFVDLYLARTANPVNNADSIYRAVKGFVAKALSDLIVDDMEQAIIKRILKNGCYHFTRDELSSLLDFINEELDSEASVKSMSLNKATRKDYVHTRVREYLDKNEEIVLEGFVRFRLKDYTKQLEEAVDRAVDEYLLEKEYGEFIRLLRYFVESQEPKQDEIHVIVTTKGEFWLADKDGKPLRNEQMDELVIEMIDGDIEYEDVLMSSLITIAPHSVIIHRPEKVEIVGRYMDTIKNVFGERVKNCPGCHLCRQDKAQQTRI